ncbi:hypothetical protein [Ascidiimonas aurantiaca]|uniref:hypothetical protein n=1 Tax=Ascidiimonas aurantiaca TaxID=1685432 RepID=UPI0030EDAC6E
MKAFLVLWVTVILVPSVYSQLPQIDPYDFIVEACANNEGWNYVTTLDAYESVKIQANQNWKSNRSYYPSTGVKHYDSRHPFPDKNAMAVIFRVRVNGQYSYHTMCCNFKSGAPLEWTLAPKSFSYDAGRNGAQIHWMVNDWQEGGLGDNSGCINLYVSKE